MIVLLALVLGFLGAGLIFAVWAERWTVADWKRRANVSETGAIDQMRPEAKPSPFIGPTGDPGAAFVGSWVTWAPWLRRRRI